MTETTEHNATDRSTAIKMAQDVSAFIEPDAESLIIVADWLLTGRANTALAFSEQRARQHGDLSLDAASWSAVDADTD